MVTGTIVNNQDNDGVCDANEIIICQDPTAINYNPNATDGCTDSYPDISGMHDS